MTTGAVVYAAMILASTAVMQAAVHSGAVLVMAAMAAAAALIISEIGVLAIVFGVYAFLLLLIFTSLAVIRSGAYEAIKQWWIGSELKLKLDSWIDENAPDWF